MVPQYVIADRTDCDGVISHALMKRTFRPFGDTTHFPSDYYDFHKMLEEVITMPSGHIYVADLDLNSNIRRYTYLFERAKNKHNAFAWLDHHVGSLSTMDFLEKYCTLINVQKDQCASMIISNTFGTKDGYTNWLVKVAQDYDYKNKGTQEYNFAQKLQEVIRSDYPTESLIEIISKDDKWQNNGNLVSELEKPRQDFLKRKPKAYSELEQTLAVQDISGLRVMFGLSNMTLYRSDAPIYLKDKRGGEADLFVVFFLNDYGPAMVYGNTDKIKVTDFCSLLGGGGRENNGGFTFGDKTSYDNYPERVRHVSMALEHMQNNINQKD